ncbi:ACP S-malonyltransferase [Streptomyces sp. NPDC006463]|uniref:ACP S-malonyltransferase n=1 Tax=Streptomyces sp. NPDC006463 TaxID=3364746 RepID=UPI00367B359E
MDQTRIGLVFPGQGTQREGMGEPWRDTPSWKITEEISDVTGEDLPRLLLHTSDARLRCTDLAQLAVFTVAVIAHAEAVRQDVLGGPVAACAGHSLGEYAALTAAGALTVGAAAALVAARGRAMRQAAEERPGTMGVLVAAPLDEVAALAGRVRAEGPDVWVANVNAPGQTVVSGSAEGIDRIEAEAPSIGAKMIRLTVGGAFPAPTWPRRPTACGPPWSAPRSPPHTCRSWPTPTPRRTAARPTGPASPPVSSPRRCCGSPACAPSSARWAAAAWSSSAPDAPWPG